MFKCSHPHLIKGKLVPCGRCVNCRKKRINDWAVRLVLENTFYKDSCFVTLTYSNENLPLDASLNKRDIQLFFKRLRKQLDKKNIKIRYFLAGEYGDKFGRPHYHAIIFGIGCDYYETILKAWSLGFIKVEPVSFHTCRYVAKYSVKQFFQGFDTFTEVDKTGKKSTFRISKLSGQKVSDQFIMMSKSGQYKALGSRFLTDDFVKSLLLKDNEDVFVRIGKFKYGLPYFFIRKIREKYDKQFLKGDVYVVVNKSIYDIVHNSLDSRYKFLFQIFRETCPELSNCPSWLEGDFGYQLLSAVPSFKSLCNRAKFITCQDFFKNLDDNFSAEISFASQRKISLYEYYNHEYYQAFKSRLYSVFKYFGYFVCYY